MNSSRSIAWLDVAVWLAAAIVAGLFLWLLLDALRGGLGMVSWEFLTTPPRRAGVAGGIGPVIVSTLLILIVCIVVSLPVGVAAAAFLAEFTAQDNLLGRLVRRSVDVLAGVPSIVFGLFGNALFCRLLGLRFSILAGGLTLACMVLPLIIRSAEVGFRSVPRSYRLAAASLGFSPLATLRHIVLPQAAPAIIVGLMLGIGRALSETAALIFTSGYVDRMPGSLFDSGRSLSIHIYDLAMNVPGGNRAAYGTAVVLVVLLLVINVATNVVATRLLQRRVETS